MNNGASEFCGEDGSLREVVLKDGQRIPADVCVLGVGVTPATSFLKDSGLNMTPSGAVTVDKVWMYCFFFFPIFQKYKFAR